MNNICKSSNINQGTEIIVMDNIDVAGTEFEVTYDNECYDIWHDSIP